MNPTFGDGIPLPPLSRSNYRYKFISTIVLCSTILIFLLILGIIFSYLLRNKFHTSSSTTQIQNDQQLEQVLIRIEPNSPIRPLCIAQNVKYRAPEEPFEKYNLYIFDATLLTSNTSISFNITIFGPDIGCTWSLDVFPMDGRTIPISGRPIGLTVFGLYDETQDSNIYRPDVSTVEYWGAETGKFAVGITGAWYGSAGVGCRGADNMVLCFS